VHLEHRDRELALPDARGAISIRRAISRLGSGPESASRGNPPGGEIIPGMVGGIIIAGIPASVRNSSPIFPSPGRGDRGLPPPADRGLRGAGRGPHQTKKKRANRPRRSVFDRLPPRRLRPPGAYRYTAKGALSWH
jgi:hypothetical protein